MSGKKPGFKGKGVKVPLNNPVPRSATEITKEYGEAVANAGKLQYLIYTYGKELEENNKRLMSLNNEFTARQNLDAAAKASQAAESKGATNEQA